ncbi:MAG: hypothetical protein ACOXZX_03190 [Synergistaceae bacterium]|jgi:hypothetical protein
MKKTIIIVMSFLITTIIVTPSLSSSRWDEFVTKSIEYERIQELGIPVINNLKEATVQQNEIELWEQLWQGDPALRCKAGLALMDRIFPNGDPSRWQEVDGFLSISNRQPRQLAGIDAFFVVVSAIRDLPDGVWASAYILEKFGKSTRGRMYFIDDTTPEIRAVLDDVINKTGLKGDWSSTIIRGHTPFLPRYNGYISMSRAMDKHMVFINGHGAIAGNGNYSWDRDGGYIYEISEQMGMLSPSR